MLYLVIVVFEPDDITELENRVSKLSSFFSVILFLNSDVEFKNLHSVKIIKNDSNLGTCALILKLAQILKPNTGSVLFFDQDTIFDFQKLHAIREKILSSDWLFFSHYSDFKRRFLSRIFKVPLYQFSGSCFKLQFILDNAICFSNLCFLDYCDWQVFWNLKRSGHDCHEEKKFIIKHTFGVKKKSIFNIFNHSVSRTFFQASNTIQLLRSLSTPFSVKIYLLLRLVFLILFIPFMDNSLLRYKHIKRALC